MTEDLEDIQLLLSKLKHLRSNDILYLLTLTQYTRLTQILFLRRRVKSPKFYHFCVLAVCVFLSFSASMSLLSFLFLLLVTPKGGWDGDKQKKRKVEILRPKGERDMSCRIIQHSKIWDYSPQVSLES